MSKIPAEKMVLRTDREGGLELAPEFMRAAKVQLGDEYAAWKEGGSVILSFLKHRKKTIRIPKRAEYGKIEPALPEESVVPCKPVAATKPIPRKRK
jgi:hypothetical protein